MELSSRHHFHWLTRQSSCTCEIYVDTLELNSSELFIKRVPREYPEEETSDLDNLSSYYVCVRSPTILVRTS